MNTSANGASLPVAVNPAGGFNACWEMPFRKYARITVENLSPDEVRGHGHYVGIWPGAYTTTRRCVTRR